LKSFSKASRPRTRCRASRPSRPFKLFLDQAAGRVPAAEGAAKLELDRNILNAGDNLKKFAEAQATVLLKLRRTGWPNILRKSWNCGKTLRDSEGLSAVKTDSTSAKNSLSFDLDIDRADQARLGAIGYT